MNFITYLFFDSSFGFSCESIGIIVWFVFFCLLVKTPQNPILTDCGQQLKAFERSVRHKLHEKKATNPPEDLESSAWKNHVINGWPSGSLINTWKRIIGRRSFHFGASSANFHGKKKSFLASGKVTTCIFPAVSSTKRIVSAKVTGASSDMGRGTLAWRSERCLKNLDHVMIPMEILTEIGAINQSKQHFNWENANRQSQWKMLNENGWKDFGKMKKKQVREISSRRFKTLPNRPKRNPRNFIEPNLPFISRPSCC